MAFARVPEELILDTSVSDRAVRVYARLDRFAGADGRAYPTQATIAEALGCSIRSVSRALDELMAAGFVDVVSGKDSGRSNRYLLTPREGYDTGDRPPNGYDTGDRPTTSPVTEGSVTGDRPGTTPVADRRRATNESQEGEGPLDLARRIVSREPHELPALLEELGKRHGAGRVRTALEELDNAGERFTYPSHLTRAIDRRLPARRTTTAVDRSCTTCAGYAFVLLDAETTARPCPACRPSVGVAS